MAYIDGLAEDSIEPFMKQGAYAASVCVFNLSEGCPSAPRECLRHTAEHAGEISRGLGAAGRHRDTGTGRRRCLQG